MITGYIDDDDYVFCVECWRKAKAMGGPASVLDTVDPVDPADTTPFWVVDPCVLCGADVKYKMLGQRMRPGGEPRNSLRRVRACSAEYIAGLSMASSSILRPE